MMKLLKELYPEVNERVLSLVCFDNLSWTNNKSIILAMEERIRLNKLEMVC